MAAPPRLVGLPSLGVAGGGWDLGGSRGLWAAWSLHL